MEVERNEKSVLKQDSKSVISLPFVSETVTN